MSNLLIHTGCDKLRCVVHCVTAVYTHRFARAFSFIHETSEELLPSLLMLRLLLITGREDKSKQPAHTHNVHWQFMVKLKSNVPLNTLHLHLIAGTLDTGV